MNFSKIVTLSFWLGNLYSGACCGRRPWKKNSIETVPSIVSIHKACRANINTFQLAGWIKYEIWQFQFSYISCILEFNIYWFAFRKFHRFVFLNSWFKVVYTSINCNIAQFNVVQLKMLFMQFQYQCVVLTAYALKKL